MLNRFNLSIAKFCNKEYGSRRWNLTNVLITPSETLATDGHRLVRVSTPPTPTDQWPAPEGFVPTDQFTPFAIPAKLALEIAKAIPSNPVQPSLNHAAVEATGDRLAVNDLDSPRTFGVPSAEPGGFPSLDPFNKQTPNPALATLIIGFNAKYLAELFAEAAKFTEDSDHTVTLGFTSPDRVMRIDARRADGQTWTAVIAPLRLPELNPRNPLSEPTPMNEPAEGAE